MNGMPVQRLNWRAISSLSDLRQRVAGLGAHVVLVDGYVLGRLVEREPDRRLARRPHDALDPQPLRSGEHGVRAHHVRAEGHLRRRVRRRRDRREVHDDLRAVQCLQRLAVGRSARPEGTAPACRGCWTPATGRGRRCAPRGHARAGRAPPPGPPFRSPGHNDPCHLSSFHPEQRIAIDVFASWSSGSALGRHHDDALRIRRPYGRGAYRHEPGRCPRLETSVDCDIGPW